jgi:hypothetical protein
MYELQSLVQSLRVYYDEIKNKTGYAILWVTVPLKRDLLQNTDLSSFEGFIQIMLGSETYITLFLQFRILASSYEEDDDDFEADERLLKFQEQLTSDLPSVNVDIHRMRNWLRVELYTERDHGLYGIAERWLEQYGDHDETAVASCESQGGCFVCNRTIRRKIDALVANWWKS